MKRGGTYVGAGRRQKRRLGHGSAEVGAEPERESWFTAQTD